MLTIEIQELLSRNRSELEDLHRHGQLLTITANDPRLEKQAEILTKLLPRMISFEEVMSCVYAAATGSELDAMIKMKMFVKSNDLDK
jgi:hypothetical protein